MLFTLRRSSRSVRVRPQPPFCWIDDTQSTDLLYFYMEYRSGLGGSFITTRLLQRWRYEEQEEGQAAEGCPTVMVPLNNVQFSRLLDFQQLLRLS